MRVDVVDDQRGSDEQESRSRNEEVSAARALGIELAEIAAMPASRHERFEWVSQEFLETTEETNVSWTCRERHLAIEPANSNAYFGKMGTEVGQRFQVSAEGHVSTAFSVRPVIMERQEEQSHK